MTKLRTYDELEMDERSRVCGGVVFQKFMKKGICRSSNGRKHDSPVLTSSSSCSSHESSARTNMYDPSKIEFCMPRQIEGAGTTTSTEHEDGFKLNFKLQAEEQNDFLTNNQGDQTSFFSEETGFKVVEGNNSPAHNVIQLDPQMINDLKSKYMQSKNKNLSPEASPEIDEMINHEKSSKFEQSMSSPNHSKKPLQLDDGFLMEEADEVNEKEDVDAVWNDLQHTPVSRSREEVKGFYESKAHGLRKEMTSFRRELDAVKKSLSGTLSGEDENEIDLFVSNGEEPSFGSQSHAVEDSLPTQSSQFSDPNNTWKNETAFASTKQSQDKIAGDQNYFKSDWNLTFNAHEVDNKNQQNNTPLGQSPPENLEDLKQNNVHSGSSVKTNETFPECPEMPFNEDLNPEEIEINETTNQEEKYGNGNGNTVKKGHEFVPSTPRGQQGKTIESDNFKDNANPADEQKKLNEKTPSTRSNYEQDMEIVRMLLRKYGENLDTTTNFEKVRSIEKARRIHAVIDAPTDAWFHRHAVGMCRKSTKSTKSHTQKANEKSHVPQKHGGSMPTKTQTEKPKSSQGTVVPIQPKKTNRVHFKEPAVETVTYTKPPPMTPRSANADRATPQHGFKPVKQNTRGTNPTKSVGKLADKIRYWENKDI